MYVVREMYVGLPERCGNPEDDFRNAQLYKNKIEKLKPITMQQYEYTNKIYYDHFVLPFTIGLVVLLGYLCVRYYKWIKSFPKEERKKIRKGLFSFKTIRSGWEIFRESLLHHNIFKTNPMLGYMHMTFAFGWFLLIVVGKIESMVYHTSAFNPPYFAIFFRYFHPAKETFPYSEFFAFLMDLILTFLLIGILLAVTKRFCSRIFGMKKTTKQRAYDLLILTVLWLIFPVRFLAESFTSGLNGGGSFLTYNAGNFFSGFLPLESLSYPAWWLYSSLLGLFFLLLPFSRYMHIPTEMVYIFLKNWGVKQGKEYNGFSEIQVNSCSRCGICINTCQLNTSCNINDTQPVYFLRRLRNHEEYAGQAEDCLMCGRCEASCPVGINLNAIRQSKRPDILRVTKDTYAYVPQPEVKPAKIAYFAGCMSHLTPGIIKSMQQIFEKAKADYTFIDEKAGVCCGRPLALSGNWKAAQVVMDKNLQMIDASQADILVTSCPICYKTFKEDYLLNIKVMHHTEYIDMLIREGKLKVNTLDLKTVFHNPCELGRGCGVVDAPESVLKQVSQKIPTAYDGKKSLCCGGSLANTAIDATQKTKISSDTVKAYAAYQPDVIVTACPLCKKTLGKTSLEIPVKDIAELVAEA